MSDFEGLYITASSAVAATFFLMEVFRAPLLKASPNSFVIRSTNLLVSGRALKVLFLLAGLMCVLYLSIEWAGEWSIVISAMGSAVVYFAFRAIWPAPAIEYQKITVEPATALADIPAVAVPDLKLHPAPRNSDPERGTNTASLDLSRGAKNQHQASSDPINMTVSAQPPQRPSVFRKAFKSTLIAAVVCFVWSLFNPDPYLDPLGQKIVPLISTLVTAFIFFFIALVFHGVIQSKAR
ncbi:hypothetical protein [Sabulicella glaciei]|uniref:hypothetical protein n=1 Tax=Sabulicella glaciei TaxID=2984948 RepID=UPI002659C62D|nr:hypothetical protein [Roseococcus sp. MDT2-1-1]